MKLSMEHAGQIVRDFFVKERMKSLCAPKIYGPIIVSETKERPGA